ncbi:MAG: PIN domain-containing protein [Bacteroidales bacterium]|nr:PIN domain-containing protein [Bacteroidales bacterium]
MKAKIFLDTNVFMDILVDGRASSSSSKRILEAIRRGAFEAVLSTQSILDAAYALRHSNGKEEFLRFTDWALGHINIEKTDAFNIRTAMQYNTGDFEDDALFSLAQLTLCDYFITSDKKLREVHGQRDPNIKVLSPEEFAQAMMQNSVTPS